MKAAKQPPSAEMIGTAAVVVDILHPVADGTLRRCHLDPDRIAVVDQVVPAAIAEYLRQNPRSRSKGYPWIQVPHDGEIDFLCLFCRTSLNTLSGRGGTPPASFWEKLTRHCELCAAQFLARMIEAVPPGTLYPHERVIAVSKLRGRALNRETKAACEYLGITNRRSYTMTLKRQIVASSRRVADVAKQPELAGQPDVLVQRLGVARQREIDLLVTRGLVL